MSIFNLLANKMWKWKVGTLFSMYYYCWNICTLQPLCFAAKVCTNMNFNLGCDRIPGGSMHHKAKHQILDKIRKLMDRMEFWGGLFAVWRSEKSQEKNSPEQDSMLHWAYVFSCFFRFLLLRKLVLEQVRWNAHDMLSPKKEAAKWTYRVRYTSSFKRGKFLL